MGTAFLIRGKVLCEDCYQEEIDYLIHSGKEEEILPKEEVDKKECDKCHAQLGEEVDVLINAR